MLVACKDEVEAPPQVTSNPNIGQTPDNNQNDRGYDYLPEKDLGGYTWRLLMIDNEAASIFESEEDVAESGTAVSQAYYDRDVWMMERYNITMESIPGGVGSINSMVLSNQLAGDDALDMGVLHTSENFSGVISNNLCYDVKTLPYVDLTMPYYNQQANKEYTVLGKQVLLNGDYPCCGGGFAMMLFNKTMMDQLGLVYPYEAILDGDWTLEMFYQYCTDAYSDSDQIGGKSEGDTFGFAGTNVGYFFWSMGGSLISKDVNGAVVPTICNDFNDQRFAKCIELIDQTWCWFETQPNLEKNMMGTIQWFEGRTLFHFFSRYMTDLMKIENFDYGLAALPKLDEDQDDYIVPSVGGVTMISAVIRDPEKVGYILEAFNQITHTTLRPALIEDMREHRILRDEESLEVYQHLQKYMTFTITTNCDPSNVLSSNKIVDDALAEHRPSLSAYAKNMENMIKGYYTRFYYGN